jgi:Polyketide cyclase / dehydrase and lipid transport
MTISIAQAQAESHAAPQYFFARWGDMATWPEWNADTEWVRLDGPFAAGSTGHLKPKGGPKVRFTIAALTDRSFVDVSHLLGARLTFDHTIEPTAAGGSVVRVAISMGGPLARVWILLLGKGLRQSVQADLDRLVATAETDAAGAANAPSGTTRAG